MKKYVVYEEDCAETINRHSSFHVTTIQWRGSYRTGMFIPLFPNEARGNRNIKHTIVRAQVTVRLPFQGGV